MCCSLLNPVEHFKKRHLIKQNARADPAIKLTAAQLSKIFKKRLNIKIEEQYGKN